MCDLPSFPGTPSSPSSPGVPGGPCDPSRPGTPSAPTHTQRNIVMISGVVCKPKDYQYLVSLDQHSWLIDKYELWGKVLVKLHTLHLQIHSGCRVVFLRCFLISLPCFCTSSGHILLDMMNFCTL